MGYDWSMCWNINTWDVLWMDKSCRKVASGRRVAGAINSLVSDMNLQLESTRVLL